MRSETRFLKNNGIYYTNNKLANVMIDNLEIDFDGDFTLLELAVGEGHILCIILRRFLYHKQNCDANKIKDFLENKLQQLITAHAYQEKLEDEREQKRIIQEQLKEEEKSKKNYAKLQLDFDGDNEKFDEIKKQLESVNFLETTPMQAFNLLYELQRKISEDVK